MSLISVVVPVFNEETNITTFYERCKSVFENIPRGTTIAIGKTSNAPQLPDLGRFDKEYYSSISEQVISSKLSDNIQELYYDKITESGYNLVNYIVKKSTGRTKSFSEMLSDIVILPYNEIERRQPKYLIFSSLDHAYFEKQNYENITMLPDYNSRLNHLKTFKSLKDGTTIEIYKIVDITQAK